MDLDDFPVGRVLTRREVVALLGASGALLFLGYSSDSSATTDPTNTSSGTCVVRPKLTEGPYYVDEKLKRSDIRSDPSDGTVKAGALLALTFNVSSLASKACTPLKDAIVDVWHCDAAGIYSDVSDPNFGKTVGKKFLRGYQVTDAKGVARFTTIYPGWYPGRTVHVHFKVRSAASATSAYEFTSQLFFDDNFTDRVYTREPYASRGTRTLRNSGDGIYNQGGSQLVLDVSTTSDGYSATFDIALERV
jgi:protocatechuate 3,4-dioxygenase beta subunit